MYKLVGNVNYESVLYPELEHIEHLEHAHIIPPVFY